ncbi:MAG TPA: hypothetical protein VKR81_08995 [Candidatus Binatia bacterium]|nr:hypothetical protein [Candidatus Binatia bacterium]
MKTSLVGIMGTLIMSLAVGGCATTTPIVSEWRNPAYSSGSFKRIMVGGLGEDTSIRRNFEDEFLIQLRAVGVDALPSYRYLTEDEKIDETKLKQAAQKAGADALIFARSIQVEQKTQYGPSYIPYTSFGLFGPHVGASWYGWGGVPTVYHYNEYISEATLFDIAKNEVVWTGTIKTTEPDDVRAAIKSYVETVMKALDAQNLVRRRE